MMKTALSNKERRIVVGLLLLVNFIYFISSRHLICTNDGSHLALVSAIVETSTVRIDPFVQYTDKVDYCRKDGAYYSDRPPGLALMSVPFYWLGKKLTDINGIPLFTNRRYPGSFVFVLFLPNIAGTLVFMLMFLFCRFFRCDFKASITSALLFAFTTPVWIESTRFFSHGLSMFLVFAAAYVAVTIKRFDTASLRQILVMSALLGLAAITEVQNVLLVGVIFIYLMYARKMTLQSVLKGDGFSRLLFGLAVFLSIYAVLFIYNFIAFGEVSLRSNLYNPSYPDERSLRTALSGNILFGLDKVFTNVWTSKVIVHWDKGIKNATPGLLILSPIFFVSLIGFIKFFRKYKHEAALFLMLIFAELTVVCLHNHVLTRHLSTILPFLFFPACFVIQEAFGNIQAGGSGLKRYGVMMTIFFLSLISAMRVFYVLNTYWGRSLMRPFPYFREVDLYLLFYGMIGVFFLLIKMVGKATFKK